MTTRFFEVWHFRPSCDRKAMHMETLSIETLSIGLALAIRIVLVLLFLPFSALVRSSTPQCCGAGTRGSVE